MFERGIGAAVTLALVWANVATAQTAPAVGAVGEAGAANTVGGGGQSVPSALNALGCA